MSGKLKLKGDMGKAMALDKLVAKMNSARGYHTLTNNYVISNKGTDDEGMVVQVDCDLASMDSVRAAADQVAAKYPRLHVLCCNAGIM